MDLGCITDIPKTTFMDLGDFKIDISARNLISIFFLITLILCIWEKIKIHKLVAESRCQVSHGIDQVYRRKGDREKT